MRGWRPSASGWPPMRGTRSRRPGCRACAAADRRPSVSAVSGGRSVAASELAAMLPVTATPSSCSRKSRWNHVRRNSPSVTARMPIDSSLATASAIATSSASRSSAAVIVAVGALLAGGEQRRRAQQAPDVVGAERRVDRAHAQHDDSRDRRPVRPTSAPGERPTGCEPGPNAALTGHTPSVRLALIWPFA